MGEPTVIGILVLFCAMTICVAMMLKLLTLVPLDSRTRSAMPEIHAPKRKRRKTYKVRPAVARQFEGW